MPKRICDVCGKERDVEGGRTCEKGHFVCKDCVWSAPALIGTTDRKYCPICNERLR